MNAYPLEARRDIAELIGELRRLRQIPGTKTAPAHLYDAVTGLLNAGAYGVRFAAARARATRYRKLFAVMSLDVAPSALTKAGESHDAALKTIAQRLGECVRATDTLARVGEENFAILLEDLSQPGQAERVKQHVEDMLCDLCGPTESAPCADIKLQFSPGRDRAASARLSS